MCFSTSLLGCPGLWVSLTFPHASQINCRLRRKRSLPFCSKDEKMLHQQVLENESELSSGVLLLLPLRGSLRILGGLKKKISFAPSLQSLTEFGFLLLKKNKKPSVTKIKGSSGKEQRIKLTATLLPLLPPPASSFIRNTETIIQRTRGPANFLFRLKHKTNLSSKDQATPSHLSKS